MVAETPRLSRVRKGLDITKVKVVDDFTSMTVIFFNQSYVKDALRPGESYVFYGKVEGYGRARQMTNPVFEREGAARFTGRIMPVYPLTHNISNNFLAGLTQRALEGLPGAGGGDPPFALRQDHALASLPFSYQNIHFPVSFEELALARRRLIFEELFYLSCGLAFLKKRRGAENGPVFGSLPVREFGRPAPLLPHGAQRRAMAEIARIPLGTALNRCSKAT